jgi:hypothetical protein
VNDFLWWLLIQRLTRSAVLFHVEWMRDLMMMMLSINIASPCRLLLLIPLQLPLMHLPQVFKDLSLLDLYFLGHCPHIKL